MQSIARNQAVVLCRTIIGPVTILALPWNEYEYMSAVHLLAAVDESLLHGRDTLLLLDPFLDLRDLSRILSIRRAVRSMREVEVPCSSSRYRARSPYQSAFAPYGPLVMLSRRGGGAWLYLINMAAVVSVVVPESLRWSKIRFSVASTGD